MRLVGPALARADQPVGYSRSRVALGTFRTETCPHQRITHSARRVNCRAACHDRRVPRPPLLTAASALLLVAAGGLAIGGSFGGLATETERAGGRTLTLTYTSWRLIQGGTFGTPIYFHAPRFGIPLVVAGTVTAAAGGLLASGRWARAVRLGAVAAAGVLVGTGWTVGLAVSADLDAVTSGPGYAVTWQSGAGLWLVMAAGVAALLGAVGAAVQPRIRTPTPEAAPEAETDDNTDDRADDRAEAEDKADADTDDSAQAEADNTHEVA